jgi:hypothetical protein
MRTVGVRQYVAVLALANVPNTQYNIPIVGKELRNV